MVQESTKIAPQKGIWTGGSGCRIRYAPCNDRRPMILMTGSPNPNCQRKSLVIKKVSWMRMWQNMPKPTILNAITVNTYVKLRIRFFGDEVQSVSWPNINHWLNNNWKHRRVNYTLHSKSQIEIYINLIFNIMICNKKICCAIRNVFIILLTCFLTYRNQPCILSYTCNKCHYKGRRICPRNAIVVSNNYIYVLQTPFGHGRVPYYMPFSLSVFIRRICGICFRCSNSTGVVLWHSSYPS